jgi:hypothetical protein
MAGLRSHDLFGEDYQILDKCGRRRSEGTFRLPDYFTAVSLDDCLAVGGIGEAQCLAARLPSCRAEAPSSNADMASDVRREVVGGQGRGLSEQSQWTLKPRSGMEMDLSIPAGEILSTREGVKRLEERKEDTRRGRGQKD